MPTTYFTGASDGQWDVAGNHDGGVPIAGDTVYILDTDRDIVDVPSDSGELAYANFYTGPKFTGQLASSSLPFFFGSVTGVVEIDSPEAEAIYIAVGTTRTVPQLTVRRNGGTQIATVIYGPGTITKLSVLSGYVLVASTAVITTIEVAPGAVVEIESGATVTNVITNGYVNNEAAIGGFVICGLRGVFDHKGETTVNITGIVYCVGGTANLFSNGGTYGGVFAGSGLVDFNGGSGKPRTVTTITRMPSCRVNKTGLGATVTFSADAIPGGDLEM